MCLMKRKHIIGGTRFTCSVRGLLKRQKPNYRMSVPINIFPDEDVLGREIETWRGFVDKLPADDEVVSISYLIVTISGQSTNPSK
jgi:hypothetical protein